MTMAARDKLASELTIRAYRPDDRDAVVEIWERCGSIVWYNDPDRDIALWCASPNAEIFVGEHKTGGGAEQILATICVGHDGHRGNPYYVAIDPDFQGRGLGRRMMRHAEKWLARLGVPKMNLMVRDTNAQVRDFYLAIRADYQVLSEVVDGTVVNSYYPPNLEVGGQRALRYAADALGVR